MSDDAKIAVFLLHRRAPSGVSGRAGGATFERWFAADLLQVQRDEIFDSIFGCAGFDCGASPARECAGSELNLPFICFAF